MKFAAIPFLLFLFFQKETLSTRVLDKVKTPKLFSLFSAVTFKNDPCPTMATQGNSPRQGTCFSASECNQKRGVASGNCASGFGVCCMFVVNNGDVVQDCTYLQNEGFPNAKTDMTGVTYNIKRISNEICSVRLDFETFNTRALPTALEDMHDCQDPLTITSTSNVQTYPTICGTNTGEHIYVDLSGDMATLAFAFAANPSARWDIKANQIECTDENIPPQGCFQYHTASVGRIRSFNFQASTENHLSNQDYSVCIKRTDGFCCIEYSQCAGEAMAFSLDNPILAAKSVTLQDNLCTMDYIRIPGGASQCSTAPTNTVLKSRFCGDHLGTDTFGNTVSAATLLMTPVPVCDCLPPFQIDIVTDANPDNAIVTITPIPLFTVVAGIATQNTALSRGVCLDYVQIPC